MRYILSVSEINRYIKEIISNDLVLSNLWVRGEISNYKYHSSGHMYFTLKDEKSLVKCVMFRTQASGVRFAIENGMKVIIRGYVSVFERDGQYQLYAEEMQPDGIGNLHIAFEQLKKRLQEEGLFDAAYKKKLPVLPKAIGVVTSSTGAVLRDIMHILNRRYANVELKIYPVQVQGDQAPPQIARAIRKLNELGCVDVIILARGGGSLEELWAFNEEIVARSIFDSEIPVVSAIGHETDFTISDFVADLRAPTPSAAAEIVVPEKAVLKQQLGNMNARLRSSLQRKLSMSRMALLAIKESIAFKQPYNKVYQERMRLDLLDKYLLREVNANKDSARSRMASLIGKLDALSPLGILARGYGIVKAEKTGRVLRSVDGLDKGDKLEVRVSDGKVYCTAEHVEKLS